MNLGVMMTDGRLNGPNLLPTEMKRGAKTSCYAATLSASYSTSTRTPILTFTIPRLDIHSARKQDVTSALQSFLFLKSGLTTSFSRSTILQRLNKTRPARPFRAGRLYVPIGLDEG